MSAPKAIEVDGRRPRIGLVLKGYPRLSETFIAQEILELERVGFDIEIISLRHPTDGKEHLIHAEIKAPRLYLPEYLRRELFRVWKAKLACAFKLGFWKANWVFIKDLMRDPTINRIRRFGQAYVLAHEYAGGLDHLYVHFLHTPASVVRYASIISGKSFSISAHAKDIWTIDEWEKKEKLTDADWLVTCTQSGAHHLEVISPKNNVHLVYHGIDLQRFPKAPTRKAWDERRVKFLTVGRAVNKKGIDSLLKALAKLPEQTWQWTHIGSGPLLDKLKTQANALGIADCCDFRGSQPQEQVLEAYREHDVFVLPSRIDEDGDRDGLPNVIVEAQSQGMAVISTNISGIPELIQTDINGILVEPDDVDALAAALQGLSENPDLAIAMGDAGVMRVHGEFSHLSTIGKVVDLLNNSISKDANDRS